MEVLALCVVPPLAGLLTRRWESVAVAVMGLPTYAVGRNQGWWGCCGTGDAWQLATALLTAGVVAATIVAVLVERLAAKRLRRSNP